MARYGSAHARETREKILTAAALAFKADGFNTVGIGRLMGKAGLTHGGFYVHFGSKDALVQEALVRSLEETSSTLLQAAEQTPPYGLGGVIRSYVSRQHRDHAKTEGSCVLPTLAAEVARQTPEVRQAFTATFTRLIEDLTALSRAENSAARRAEVLPLLPGMVGAVMLSCAVSDPELSDAILKTTRESLMRQVIPGNTHDGG
ncbi:TetR/AcrR family transcriptional regulator [Deinococcus yavapaiensis]|uniref:TetR family transcriptional regulator n=1 Tax=Deinococcus yavapaiensis KR-236 TaxID=694435 RepID=A0A318SHH2_9DEIO|nr:TetR/AcrR family transcriptional regulator [Deinococcus yavapaiensis]PYE50462.1 TetR family transcriptional regulator [Deinococcus yavapaiensis KR-236]